MGTIVSAMGSSHAYAFLPPDEWDKRREQTRARYRARYRSEVPEQAQISDETLQGNRARYKQISGVFELMRARLSDLKLDALVVLGDDQNENFTEDNLPQFAIYIGNAVRLSNRTGKVGASLTCASSISTKILKECVDAKIDLAYSKSFNHAGLISHAHREPLEYLSLGITSPIIPIFVNAINVPAPTPSRCYEFGQILREAIQSLPDDKRIGIYASGGLSHFTAGYPWRHYDGPYTFGAISTEFDREVIAYLREGKGSELGNLSSADLLEHGDIELRQWIVMAGALGTIKPKVLTYEPFYRALMGMAAGYWEL